MLRGEVHIVDVHHSSNINRRLCLIGSKYADTGSNITAIPLSLRVVIHLLRGHSYRQVPSRGRTVIAPTDKGVQTAITRKFLTLSWTPLHQRPICPLASARLS